MRRPSWRSARGESSGTACESRNWEFNGIRGFWSISGLGVRDAAARGFYLKCLQGQMIMAVRGGRAEASLHIEVLFYVPEVPGAASREVRPHFAHELSRKDRGAGGAALARVHRQRDRSGQYGQGG